MEFRYDSSKKAYRSRVSSLHQEFLTSAQASSRIPNRSPFDSRLVWIPFKFIYAVLFSFHVKSFILLRLILPVRSDMTKLTKSAPSCWLLNTGKPKGASTTTRGEQLFLYGTKAPPEGTHQGGAKSPNHPIKGWTPNVLFKWIPKNQNPQTGSNLASCFQTR